MTANATDGPAPLARGKDWIEGLTPGVRVAEVVGQSLTLSTVDKIDRLYVHVGKRRYLRRNGRMAGSTYAFHPPHIREVTDADLERLERAALVEAIRDAVGHPDTPLEILRAMRGAIPTSFRNAIDSPSRTAP